MRLDLEVLDLAVEILRGEAGVLAVNDTWSEHCTEVADNLADIIEQLEQDG